jgi:group I intron endonuclease
MSIGIYGIKNTINNKIYIGQSIHIYRRFTEHRRELNKGIHKNVHLQRAWNKYRQNNFEFFILLECDISQLNIMEEQQANQVPNGLLYNINNNFTSCIGMKNPFFGKKHSKKSKNKMSEWKKEHYNGKNNPNYGKKQPLSVRLAMTNNNSCTKLKAEDVLIIVNLLKSYVLHEIIAQRFKVSRTVITRISNGTRWQNITGGPVFPIIYKYGVRQFSEDHRNKIGNSHRGKKYKTKENLCLE